MERVIAEPVIVGSVTVEPVIVGSVTVEPVIVGPVIAEPLIVGSVTVEPVSVGPVTVEPVSVGSVTVEPVSVGSVTVEPVIVGPVTVEPVIVEPVIAEPVIMHPLITHVTHPYLIAFHYDDQLGGATRGFVQLVNTTVHWNRRPVEPFVVNAHYVAVPSPSIMQGIYHFHDIYNLSGVEVQLSECFSHPMTFFTFEEFLLNSTREFVLLEFSIGNKPGSIKDCTHAQNAELRRVESDLNKHLNDVKSKAIAKYGENYTFKGIRAVCVDASKFSIKEVKRAVEGDRARNQQHTVVVLSWRYVKNVPDPNGYYFHDPSYGKLDDTCYFSFPHSALVVQSAEEFRTSLGLQEIEYVGLHFRLEWLQRDDSKKPGYLEKCMDTTRVAFKTLVKKYNLTSKSVIAINDYSNYGTDVILVSRSKHDRARKELVDRLDSWGVKTVAYDPAFFGRPLHRGFVSLVEKELLSNANYLLTVGGGIYQKSIRARFAKKHGTGQLFAVCQRKHADILPNQEIK